MNPILTLMHDTAHDLGIISNTCNNLENLIDTNKVRELLCIKCNSAIGHLNDDINLVYISLVYLLKHKDINLIEFLEEKLKELKGGK